MALQQAGFTPELTSIEESFMTRFSAELARHMHGHVLTVCGELDLDTGAQVRAATATATRQWVLPHATMLIDLTNMTFIDGAGLGALVDSRLSVLRSDRTFQLAGASTQTCRIMTLTGLWDLVEAQVEPQRAF